MNTVTRTLLAAAFSAALPFTVSAASITIADGDTWCDSANLLVSTASCVNPGSREDLGQSAANDDVTFLGEGAILGFVRDKQGTSDRYADAAEITLTQDSMITFSLVAPTHDIFTGTLNFGSQVSDAVFDATSDALTFFAAAGTYTFSFDATKPDERKDNTTQYLFEVAAVPLPASALLLIGGVAGLGFVRSRKKSA